MGFLPSDTETILEKTNLINFIIKESDPNSVVIDLINPIKIASLVGDLELINRAMGISKRINTILNRLN